MNNRDNIQDELNGLNSDLPANANQPPLSVPEGYFDGLAAAVLARVKAGAEISAAAEIAELSPLLAGISRTMPYEVPESFFQSNLEMLPFLVSEQEESALLSLIEKEMPYEVPQGYFASLPEQILAKVAEPTAKVIPMVRRKWMRMMAAAVMIGIITLSGIFYFRSNNNNNDGATNNNTTVTTAATVPVTVELKKASTEELNNFISDIDVSTATDKTQATASNSKPHKDTKNLFEDVSDEELKAFLSQVPTDDEELDIN
jgi:hypothetical protein